MEYHLIEKAKKNNQLDSENKQKGHKPKVDMFHEPKLKAYLFARGENQANAEKALDGLEEMVDLLCK